MALEGNISIGAPGSIPTPPAGEVTRFFNTDFSPPRLYYKDETTAVFPFPCENASESEDCCCEIAEDLIGKIGCALEEGMIDAEAFQAIVSQGLSIVGTSTDDGAGNKTCSIVLGASNVPVTGITVTPTVKPALAVGSQFVVVPHVLPANASNRTVIWASDNVAKATVDQNGVVTGVAAGVANITATTADGLFTASCAVTVV